MAPLRPLLHRAIRRAISGTRPAGSARRSPPMIPCSSTLRNVVCGVVAVVLSTTAKGAAAQSTALPGDSEPTTAPPARQLRRLLSSPLPRCPLLSNERPMPPSRRRAPTRQRRSRSRRSATSRPTTRTTESPVEPHHQFSWLRQPPQYVLALQRRSRRQLRGKPYRRPTDPSNRKHAEHLLRERTGADGRERRQSERPRALEVFARGIRDVQGSGRPRHPFAARALRLPRWDRSPPRQGQLELVPFESLLRSPLSIILAFAQPTS